MTQEQLNNDLLKACEDGKLSAVKKLLNAGVDVNVKDKKDGTALHYASFYQKLA